VTSNLALDAGRCANARGGSIRRNPRVKARESVRRREIARADRFDIMATRLGAGRAGASNHGSRRGRQHHHLAIWDSGDGILDSLASIDNFTWSVETPVIETKPVIPE